MVGLFGWSDVYIGTVGMIEEFSGLMMESGASDSVGVRRYKY